MPMAAKRAAQAALKKSVGRRKRLPQEREAPLAGESACPIYESAGSVKAFRWDFLGFVRPFEHTFTSG
jgi:hypothetical protein